MQDFNVAIFPLKEKIPEHKPYLEEEINLPTVIEIRIIVRISLVKTHAPVNVPEIITRNELTS
jgi:hypothetical protein